MWEIGARCRVYLFFEWLKQWALVQGPCALSGSVFRVSGGFIAAHVLLWATRKNMGLQCSVLRKGAGHKQARQAFLLACRHWPRFDEAKCGRVLLTLVARPR